MDESFEGRGCWKLHKDQSETFCCLERGGNKLNATDWTADIPDTYHNCDLIEVRFKNTRKGYYKNVNNIKLKRGDVVAVEASPGHDIGIVALTGVLAQMQLNEKNPPPDAEFRKIYRKAKPADVDKWKESMAREFATMITSRKVASDLALEMKIGDVEYQGDGTKAIFYYIADDRVDFREMIKILAEQLKVRIEMKQIGARQEAGRIGGIGSCGRELCCATWITNFISVTTNAARCQEVSLNPQKLTGQCSKLKCCLNYEVVSYVDAQKDFPDISAPLQTEQGMFYHQKTDVFKRIMWYSSRREMPSEIICLTVEQVKETLQKNKQGIKVKKLESFAAAADITPIIDYQHQLLAESSTLSKLDDKPANNNNNNSQYRKNHKRRR
jgi:cell fate regulator YaaT (PSP1 superfamily)